MGSFNFRLRTHNVPSGSRPKHLKRGRRPSYKKMLRSILGDKYFWYWFLFDTPTSNGESCISLKFQIIAGNRKVPSIIKHNSGGKDFQ